MPPSGVTKGYQRTLSNTRLQHDDSIDLSFGTIMAGANPTLLKAKFSRPKDTLLDKIIPKFVSKHVRNMCHELQAASPDSAVTLEPSATESFAAVVMVDVSQYSKLTATLAERGSVGVGLLSATMKGYFDQIIEIINNHGGDVVKFAGDALVFCWKSKDLTEITDPSGDVSRGNLVYKASRCCLQLLTDLGTYAVDIKDCDTKLLKIHLGIGAGIVFDVVVGGGRQQRWEHFIAGEGASQLSQVLDLAKAGELALSHQALKWLTFIIDIRTLNLGNYDKRCIILTGLEKAEKKCEPPVIVEPSITYDLPGQLAGNLDLNKKFMDRTALFKLQDDLHQSMLFGMDVSLKELLGLSELRQVTTIFIKIGSLQVVHRGTLLDESQRAISIVLNALDKCEGNLRQFHVDDKGAVILCFFGLPPMAHENDAMLGIQAGIEIQKGFKEIFDNFSIGITTGVLSFGGVGTKDRAEYAVMGDAINMAARLMCLPQAREGILCDERSFKMCQKEFMFESLGETKVKGKSAPISIFQPRGMHPRSENSKTTMQKAQKLIGRQNEKDIIQEVLQNLNNLEAGSTYFEADGGQGLNSLAEFVVSECEQISAPFAVCKFSHSDRHIPYLGLLELLNKIALGMPHIAEEVNLQVETKISVDLPSLPEKIPMNIPIFVIEPFETSQDILSATDRELNKLSPEALECSSPTGTESRWGVSMDNLETPEPYKAVEKRPTIFDCQSMINIRGMASQLKLSQDTTKHLQDIYDFATIADASVDSEKQLLNTTNAVCTCFKAILSVSPMVLILQEVQLTDIYTLSVLKDVIDNCDNACVFMFGRPGFTFENKSCKVMIDSIQQSDFVNHIELKGFNLSDTKELIQQIWDEEALTSVSQDIALNILTRTAGNPYLIESLTSSMKVTGKWVISVTGELVSATKDLDGDALSLGYDNQGVVLARFDRLDRNMQLFFKIAAVIGEKFCLDDVLYFMTGIEGISKDMDSKTYNGLVKGVVTSDQYGFLQLDSKGGAGGGAYFAFKSSLVRKCVYNLMAHKQRQHAHLHAAQYLESRITDANKNESYLSIFEHYMETSDVHMEKKIYYLELVAASYYKFGICNEAIKYYRLLCELCSRMNMLQNPNYYRELGDMLLSAGYLVDGHRNINESLYHQDIEVPHSARKMAQQYAKLDAAQKKENVNFFAQAIFNVAETPYQMPAISSTRSSMSRRGRKMSLIPAGVQVNNPQAVNAVSPLFHDARISKDLAIQHCFWLLAEYYRMIEDFESHKYVVLAGLVKHASCQNQSITAMLYSSAALIARLTEPNKSTLSKSYMRVATGLDNRSDITVSAKILKNQSFLALINEEFELANELMSKCIACCRLLSSKKTSMRCKSVQVFVGSLCKGRQVSYTTGKAILSECQTSGYIYERFWGNFHCLHLLLLEEGSANQIFPNEPLFLHLQELIEFQRECPPDLKNLLKIKMATSVLDLYVAIMTDKPVPWLALNMLHDNFKKASRGDWIVVIALLPLVAGLLVAHARDLVKPRSIEGKLLDKTLGEINNSLKRINLPFREPFRRAFKGIRLLFSSTPTKACVAWKKGLQDNSDNLYIQGLLNFVIGHYGQSPQHLQKGLSVIKSLGYDYLAVMISKQKRGHDKT